MFAAVVGASICLSSENASAQPFKTDVDFHKLRNLIGVGLEDGAGISVGQIEANEGNPSNGEFEYLANQSDTEFSRPGFLITDGTGSSTDVSSHANGVVGYYLYGNTQSMTPGITDITGFEVNDWIFNKMGTPLPGSGGSGTTPVAQNFRVSNHSYVVRRSAGFTAAEAENFLARVDYIANENETTIVVGSDNISTLPYALVQGYNTITVGRSNGRHSSGLTDIYGNPGRVKPEIVIPGVNTTSRATAVVSSAAALIHHKADNMGNADGARIEVVKAVLLAGATKNEPDFENPWSHTQTQPLDSQTGAGELSIFNSYFIMNGGEFDGSATQPTSMIGNQGWDYGETLSGGDSLFYEFDLGNQDADDLSVILTWNLQVDEADLNPAAGFNPTDELANLSLRIYDSTGGVLGALVDQSISSVDNIEHLYFDELASGRYTIEVAHEDGIGLKTTDFGLAWRFQAVPEPGSVTFLMFGIGAMALRRRRS